MKLSKSLSQVFLKDKDCIHKILSNLDIRQKDVLEIGSGVGQMSERIAEQVKKLYCIELDSRFIPILKEKFAGNAKVEIIHADILKFDLKKLDRKIIVFGNVPYNISNSLIEYLVENRGYIEQTYLTLQKEFVEKLAAKASTKPYGFLSCYIQYYAKVERLFDIPAKAFSPVPQVDSAFIRLKFYPQPIFKAKDEDFLFKIIRQAFSQRRKKIINSLPRLADNPDILKLLNINPDNRPENLSLKEYIHLTNKLDEENHEK